MKSIKSAIGSIFGSKKESSGSIDTNTSVKQPSTSSLTASSLSSPSKIIINNDSRKEKAVNSQTVMSQSLPISSSIDSNSISSASSSLSSSSSPSISQRKTGVSLSKNHVLTGSLTELLNEREKRMSSDSGSSYKDKNLPIPPTSTTSSKTNSSKTNHVNTLQLDNSSITEKQKSALEMIKRQVKKKNALRLAQEKQQWQIFTNLDTRDEMEMLHLATFFQTLLDEVPGLDQYETKLDPSISDDSTDVPVLAISPQQQSFFTSDDIGGNQNHKNYDIGKAALSSKVAESIVKVYSKEDGRCHAKLVMKILRQVYKQLKEIKNTIHVSIPKGCKLTVVGDLHGQLPDLLHIFDKSGFPSDTNKYIFNGDYVDRGSSSIEVIVILFVLSATQPNNVILNRGNHEDMSVNRVYGFQAECQEKYDDLTYQMFCEVFKYLPLFVVIEHSILVVHGGLFHSTNVTMDDLDAIERADYVVKPAVPYPQNIEGLSQDASRLEYLKQLQRDALWSDPKYDEGLLPNPRGAGVSFGPDIADAFMNRNNIKMVIRSHECVRNGYEFPFNSSEDSEVCDEGKPLLCTLFSASNYNATGQNDGAYIVVFPHYVHGSQAVADSGLFYLIARYNTSSKKESGSASSDGGTPSLEESNHNSLMDLLMKKKIALKNAFCAFDAAGAGTITRIDWSAIITQVTGIKIRWLSIINKLCPAEALTSNAVDYNLFLQSINVEKAAYKIFEASTAGDDMMDAMYLQRKKLEHIFFFFDIDGNGSISRDEFKNGCDKLNSKISNGKHKLTEIDHTLDLMDFDGSDSIDINEFFEVFRILDAADGKVDGVLSLANKA